MSSPDVARGGPSAPSALTAGTIPLEVVHARSFTRKRLIDLVFGAAVDSKAQGAKTGAENLQKARAAGDGGPVSP